MAASEEKPTVLVTGFGPFGVIKINSSMLAVKELEASKIKHKINLVTEEIPVVYDYIKNHVPELWEKYKPKLCVHVGVHALTETVLLEACAHNNSYRSKLDIDGNLHTTDSCIPGAPDVMHTSLDLKKVLEDVNESGSPCEIHLSDDAGRYLCDFTYFTSLHHGNSPSVFIHVPPVEGPYTEQQLGETLRLLVDAMLKQIN